ncbi:MAG: L,D-transpeptidase family protein [Ilumatobacteraceae bacterium]
MAGLVLVTGCSRSAAGGSTPSDAVSSVPAPTTTALAESTGTIGGESTTTTTTTTSSSTTTTTTTTEPPLDVYDPLCVVEVEPGDSLELIADRFDDETVSGPSVQAENALADGSIHPGQLLDVCVDNGVNDVTGEAITERNAVLLSLDVQEQQTKLNELFAGLGIRELLVDGISGPVTRQRLCAARLALGLPVSTADMEPGSEEEHALMAATSIPVPFTTAILSERWILIDRTCQIMFVGAGVDGLVFVFPTSTGEPGYETRDQDRRPAGRFNPALGNGGWHNSTIYPAAEDNPLNGNMYKPLYFDRGQAIHGANNVPTSPQSKGCARLRVEHHDMLLGWLGLSGPTSSRGQINVTVNVQGTWVP